MYRDDSGVARGGGGGGPTVRKMMIIYYYHTNKFRHVQTTLGPVKSNIV